MVTHAPYAPRRAAPLVAVLALVSAGCARGTALADPPGRAAVGGGPGGARARTAPPFGPSHTVEPTRVTADAAHVRQLRVPPGFAVGVYATGLRNARMVAVGPEGTVYVTRRDQGDVLALPDRDHDGRADQVLTAASGLRQVNGIALHLGRMYLAAPTRVYVADVHPDGTLGPPRVLIDGLPEAGRHPNRTVAVGPDQMLYVSVGSSCNACVERNPEHATLLRARLDGQGRAVFARGLRNTIGFAWHPTTGQLWGMDHGVDERGDDTPREELNLLTAGGDYGWPFCLEDRAVDPRMEGASAARCAGTRGAVAGYTAHAAPMAMAFYRGGGAFPAEYAGDAFVAMHGSWNRLPPSGYEVVRVRFANGQPVGFEPFLTGFLLERGAARFGRPTGLAFTPAGDALLVTDDENGVLYRVTYAPRAVRG